MFDFRVLVVFQLVIDQRFPSPTNGHGSNAVQG